jgi:hypothetical protein
MTNPDILALIEKVETIRSEPGDAKDYEEYTDGWIDACNSVLDLIHSAPTQPEPVVPTDQQLRVFACEWWNKFGFIKNKATCAWVIDEIDPDHFVDFLRDTFARWGTPTNHTREEN